MLHLWSTSLRDSVRRSSLILSLLLLCALLASPSQSYAQWNIQQQFSSPIVTIYFMPFAGEQMKGFVGLESGEIWRTTTEGMGPGWTAAATPANTGIISSITFKDNTTGWASFYDADKNSGGVLKTIDAGANWTVQTTHRMALAVYYHAPSSTLFLSTSAPGQATPIKKSVFVAL
jgi:hypothetical protein